MGDDPCQTRLSPAQRLLLTVILAGEDAAVAAWERLRPRFSVESLEPGSFQVMPMLAERLTALDLGHPDLPRLRGIRRQAAWRAKLAAHDAAAFVSAVHRSGSPHLLLDGPPLSCLLYGEVSRRPVTGMEVVVPAEGLSSACEALAADGWQPWTRFGIALRAHRRRTVRWKSPTGLPCALRPDLPPDLLSAPGVDRDEAWLASTPVDVDNVRIELPAPIDVVSHLSLPRKRMAPDRRCLWAVDVAHALHHPGLQRTELERRAGMSQSGDGLPAALRTLADMGVAAADVVVSGPGR